MRKVYVILFLSLALLLVAQFLIFGGDPGDEDEPFTDPPETDTLPDGWVYAHIQYQHDLLQPNEYFMILKDYPNPTGEGVPEIIGGYATTDVYARVRLRGVDTPRALQTAPPRQRPHAWIKRERYRWDDAMKYVWNIIQPHRTFRVGNITVLEEDEILEADIEYFLGGEWHDLATSMLLDERARPPDSDWDWGSSLGSLVNPNIPE